MNIEVTVGRVTIFTTIVLAIVGGAYKLGSDLGEERVKHLETIVSEYKKSSDINLPESLSSLRDAAKNLSLSKSERARLESLKIENDKNINKIEELESSISDLKLNHQRIDSENSKKISELSEKAINLEHSIKSYERENESFSIKKGEAVELVKGKYSLGVGSVYDDYAWIYLNNKSQTMNVGNVVSFNHSNRECELRLMSIKENTVNFILGCTDK